MTARTFIYIPSQLVQKPTRWWTLDDDRAMINAIYTYGYARYDEIKTNVELSYSSSRAKYEEDEGDDDEEKDKVDSNGWPTADVLTRRVKRLVECIRKVRLIKAMEEASNTGEIGDADGDGNNNKSATGPTHFSVRKSSFIWTVPMMQKFIAALGNFGIVRDRFRRPKVDRIMAKAGLPRNVLPNVINLLAIIMHDLDSVSAVKPLEQSDDSGNKFQLPRKPFIFSYTNSHILSYPVALALKKRLSLLHDLRTVVLPKKDLVACLRRERQLRTLPSKPPGLFNWWQVGRHDRALLRGVARHGLCEWGRILDDTNLGWPSQINQHKNKKKLAKGGNASTPVPVTASYPTTDHYGSIAGMEGLAGLLWRKEGVDGRAMLARFLDIVEFMRTHSQNRVDQAELPGSKRGVKRRLDDSPDLHISSTLASSNNNITPDKIKESDCPSEPLTVWENSWENIRKLDPDPPQTEKTPLEPAITGTRAVGEASVKEEPADGSQNGTGVVSTDDEEDEVQKSLLGQAGPCSFSCVPEGSMLREKAVRAGICFWDVHRKIKSKSYRRGERR